MSKNEFSAKIRLWQFLDHAVTQLHEKIRKKESKAPKENIEHPTNRRMSERKRDHSFHRTLCLQRPRYNESLTIFMAIFYLLDILLNLLKYFDNFQSCQTKSKCPSSSSCPSAHGVPQVSSLLSASGVRVLECLECQSASVNQLVIQQFSQLAYNAASVS